MIDERLQVAVLAVQVRFAAEVQELHGEVTLLLPAQHIAAAARHLKTSHAFAVLLDITAVDYGIRQSPRFHVVYQLYNIEENLLLRLRLPLEGSSPKISSIEEVYPNANWKEREVWDMFGIIFDGHSDLRRILMPEDWEGHPLRKDYPLGYEEVQYTFNFDEVERRKPYARGLR